MAGRHSAPVGARNRSFKITDKEYDFLKRSLSYYRENFTPLDISVDLLTKEFEELNSSLKKFQLEKK